MPASVMVPTVGSVAPLPAANSLVTAPALLLPRTATLPTGMSSAAPTVSARMNRDFITITSIFCFLPLWEETFYSDVNEHAPYERVSSCLQPPIVHIDVLDAIGSA